MTNWDDITNIFDRSIPDWKSNPEWAKEFVNSNRNYFDLAIGTLLTVYLPFEE